ncbi:hypothetical protein MtrunA17_Chr3g0079251 [Medicago truncatula]|uniref:Uncharacterized protein n=1 Tax=Medicago truncatula TaxID=3880 RepID=A0A396IKW0_MEDTR|nr:hypothetical protein MtrunA17_Chr3g0079251 [Medicago truncatula]
MATLKLTSHLPKTTCIEVTSWQIHIFYVRLVVILWKTINTYSFNVTTTINFDI